MPDILEADRRYHRRGGREYEASGASLRRDRPGAGHREARQAARGAAAGPFPRGARDRRGHGLLQDSTCCRDGRHRLGHLHGHLARGCSTTLAGTPPRLGLEVETAACDAASLPFPDGVVRPRVRPCRAAPPARPGRRVRASSRACCAPGGTLLLRRRALAPAATASAAVPKGAAWRLAPLWRRAVGGAPAPDRVNGVSPGRPTTTGSGSRGRSTCTRSSPADLEAAARGRAGLTSECAARSCSPTGSAGSTARSRRAPIPKGMPWPWIRYAYRGYLAPAAASTSRLLEAAAAAAALLQPDAPARPA